MSSKNKRIICNYLSCVKALEYTINKAQHIDKSVEEAASTSADKNIVRAIVSGVIRNYETLTCWVNEHTKLKPKDTVIKYLIMCGVFQYWFLERRPGNAVIYQAAQATAELNREWAKPVVYAVLKKAQASSIVSKKNLPTWLMEKIQKAYDDKTVRQILEAWQTPPVITPLRVNPCQIGRTEYLESIESIGIEANTCPISRFSIHIKSTRAKSFPGIKDQQIYVQDCIHQKIAESLPTLGPRARVLDACAAPGGKTSALLCNQPQIQILAIDKQKSKIKRLNENLSRYPQVSTAHGDALQPETWWDKVLFDAILCDAPCSGTGTIQRHPEVKLIQSNQNIKNLQQQQAELLNSLWPLLKDGGVMLYSTCSILPEENQDIIAKFLKKTPTCTLKESKTFIPDGEHAGGFYAKLVKRS